MSTSGVNKEFEVSGWPVSGDKCSAEYGNDSK